MSTQLQLHKIRRELEDRVVERTAALEASEQLLSAHVRELEERAQEAIRLRKLQELSIDVSSHELRNPLSGIVQHVELMSESMLRVRAALDALRSGEIDAPTFLDRAEAELRGDSESVEAIQICARHQRRIADDMCVSELSKMFCCLAPMR